MLVEEYAYDGRNLHAGAMYLESGSTADVYDGDWPYDVDAVGIEVTPTTVLQAITGRQAPGTPWSQRLQSDENTSLLVSTVSLCLGVCAWREGLHAPL